MIEKKKQEKETEREGGRETKEREEGGTSHSGMNLLSAAHSLSSFASSKL